MFFIINSMICIIFFCLLSFISKKNNWKKEKNMVFECGFNSLNKTRSAFSLRFFKLSIIFLLFDIEIIMILPLPVSLNLNTSNLIICNLILMIIFLGLIMEWWQGALDWIK